MNFDQKISVLAKRAETLGLKSFVFGTLTSDNLVSLHFHAINIPSAIKILMGGIHQALQIELANRKDENEKKVYEKVFAELLIDLNSSMEKANKTLVSTLGLKK